MFPPERRFAPPTAKYPIGMLFIQVAVWADHFRLDPNAQFESDRMHFFRKSGKALGEFFSVHIPIAQAARIVATIAVPPVVNHDHIHTQ